jgi:hypothetical protein
MISIKHLFNKYDYDLEPDQQDFIIKNYTKHSILELAQLSFKSTNINERSPEAKKIKNFLVKLARPQFDPIELTEEQRDIIENLSQSMKPLELCKKLFNKPDLKPLSKEVKTVDKYIKILGLNKNFNPEVSTRDELYRPPKAASKIIWKVNSAKHEANLVEGKLNNFQLRCVESLKSYLHNNRFIATINAIRSVEEKDLFESEFINGTWDKPDLNSEELNMYISLCSDYVLLKQIKQQLDILNDELKDSIEDEDKSIKVALTEAFGKKASEYDSCAKRLKSLQEALSGARSKRMEHTSKINSSLSVFVELWKDEEERKKMILVAKAREAELSKEIERLDSAEEYIAKVMGISKEEMLNG